MNCLEHARLVSTVGPGGVGKTRLALRVAADALERYPGGIWYVDLVPVTDPAMVAAAAARGTNCSDWTGRTAEDALTDMFGDRTALLILDNCEHLVDAVARLVETLLTRCARLRVLVTSRTRLVLPFERVYEVAGMSLPDVETEAMQSDAVDLFVERAGAFMARPRESTGSRPPDEGAPDPFTDRQRVAAICERLGGLALAIELAASRVAALGLDGIEAALSDQVHLLVGGARMSTRHRSLPELLQWSYLLLDPVEQAVFRRVSVFAAPFDPAAAAAVASFDPVPPDLVPAVLGRLCEQSLLSPVFATSGTRYRALEPIRQFASRELASAEADETRRRHLDWTANLASALAAAAPGDAAWCRHVDAAVDDMRAAFGWMVTAAGGLASDRVDFGPTIAHLLFNRGRLRDAQDAYERAALVAAAAGAGRMLSCASAVAKCRTSGDDAARLGLAAAAAFERAGDPAAASITLSGVAEHWVRFSGMYADPPPRSGSEALLEKARRLGAGDDRATTAVLTAEAHLAVLADLTTTERAVARALTAAERGADPVLLSSVLDAATIVAVKRRDLMQSVRIAVRRVDPLTSLTADSPSAFELKDALHMAAFVGTGAGDLVMSRRIAQQHLELPFTRDERDVAAEDLLTPAALSGHWEEALRVAPHYRDSWERSGRPRAPGRGIAAAAVSLIHGLRGDENDRHVWLDVLAGIRGVDLSEATKTSYGYVFDAILHLHTGHASDALAVLQAGEETASDFYDFLFSQWRAALTAEAAVLCGHRAARDLARAAEESTRGNRLAAAITRRAQAIHDHDRTALVDLAATFADVDCPYQHARTLVLTGGAHHAAGETAMAALGAAPGWAGR
jgi:predicted ATPase